MNQGARRFRCAAVIAAAMLVALCLSAPALASSHMDAPLITLDDAANTTDVYAFLSRRGDARYLSTALAVYPFEEPGIGPNNFRFDDDVLYEIHVAVGNDVAAGRPTFTYQFRFDTSYQNRATILQAFLDRVENVAGPAQNMVQRYRVTRVDRRGKRPRRQRLGHGVVPPNNQGLVTPFYNQGDDGSQPARDGVGSPSDLDRYTQQSIANLGAGHVAFAGQRDDGFYADIQAIFEGLAFRSGEDRFDSQGGFNVHTIALDIPLHALGGGEQVVGVYATTSRPAVRVIRNQGKGKAKGKKAKHKKGKDGTRWVQVGRQGNPLFNEGFVAIEDKDRYNRTHPSVDAKLFAKYASEPELAKLVNGIFGPAALGFEVVENDRSDLAGIFIPDVIKVDLSTAPARLAGSGEGHPTNPDDADYSRLSIFGGDTLQSQVQAGLFGNGTVPGGWPNGRRWGDDVVDIAVSALFSDLRSPDPAGLVIRSAAGIDNVSANDIGYNRVFPYAATPLNGRNHGHH